MNNFEKVFSLFRKHYILVPLETFGSNKYKTLVSTVLSARTRDEVSLECSQRLFKVAPNIRELDKLSVKEIEQAVYPVGFYKTKTRHLKKLAEVVLERFDGKIPNTRTGLESLPGVGRKTANLVLNRAFAKPAIAVDTHVHRISNLLGWVKTKTPSQTESELIKVLPKKYWSDMNRLFVSIGRQYTSKKKLVDYLTKHSLTPNEPQ